MEIRKGVVRGFDATTYTATVQVEGSLGTWLEGVPVARNISAAEMVAGRRCALLLFDPSTPSDGVVIAVFT